LGHTEQSVGLAGCQGTNEREGPRKAGRGGVAGGVARAKEGRREREGYGLWWVLKGRLHTHEDKGAKPATESRQQQEENGRKRESQKGGNCGSPRRRGGGPFQTRLKTKKKKKGPTTTNNKKVRNS